jgi:hypothetical protein
LDHQLGWLVWYTGVDIGGPAGGVGPGSGRCCMTPSEASTLGDSIALVDAQTGELIEVMSGPAG